MKNRTFFFSFDVDGLKTWLKNGIDGRQVPRFHAEKKNGHAQNSNHAHLTN